MNTRDDLPTDLPPLHETLLDEDTLDTLFNDIRQYGRLIEVIVKQTHRVQTPDKAYSFDEAQQMLTDGSAIGVQIRYIHEDTQWWDTLMHTPQGIRLVRIRHDFTDSAVVKPA